MVVVRGWGRGGENYCLMGAEFVLQDEEVLEMGLHTSVNVLNPTELYTLKKVKMANLPLCVFQHNYETFENRKALQNLKTLSFNKKK